MDVIMSFCSRFTPSIYWSVFWYVLDMRTVYEGSIYYYTDLGFVAERQKKIKDVVVSGLRGPLNTACVAAGQAYVLHASQGLHARIKWNSFFLIGNSVSH